MIVASAARFQAPALGGVGAKPAGASPAPRRAGFQLSRRSGTSRQARQGRRVKAAEPELNDTPGVDSLISRDRKVVELSEAAFSAFAEDEPAAPAAAAAATAVAGKASSKGGKGKRGKRRAAAAAAGEQGGAAVAVVEAGESSGSEEEEEEEQPVAGERGPASQRAGKLRGEGGAPRRAREAIDQGLAKFQAGDYRAAIDLFQLSLELPGSGVMRLSGSVREYSCPSEGEENAALFNMACCWAAMGQKDAALTVLDALLENNFEDVATIRRDPDLASLRGPELDKILSKHDGLVAKLFGKKKPASSGSGNKPWLQW